MSDPDYPKALRKARADVLEARGRVRDAQRKLARVAFAGDYATARVELRNHEAALLEANAALRALMKPREVVPGEPAH